MTALDSQGFWLFNTIFNRNGKEQFSRFFDQEEFLSGMWNAKHGSGDRVRVQVLSLDIGPGLLCGASDYKSHIETASWSEAKHIIPLHEPIFIPGSRKNIFQEMAWQLWCNALQNSLRSSKLAQLSPTTPIHLDCSFQEPWCQRRWGKKKVEWVQNHYQQGLEQASLGDVEPALLGQDLNVLDFIVEPVEDE